MSFKITQYNLHTICKAQQIPLTKNWFIFNKSEECTKVNTNDKSNLSNNHTLYILCVVKISAIKRKNSNFIGVMHLIRTIC